MPFVAFQPRPRMTTRPRAMLYEPRASREEKVLIEAAFRRVSGWTGAEPMFDGPVNVEIAVTAPLPQSRPRRVGSEPNTVKPDADNIAKKVMDALNGVAYRDDAQVTRLVVEKLPRRRGALEETRVLVRRAEGGDSE